MRISKKGIEEIIDRLYTTEQNGEKVIRRDRLDELFGIVTRRYNNAGCCVENVSDGEILVISSVSKSGIRKIFERKIEATEDRQENCSSVCDIDESWHKEELICLLKKSLRNMEWKFLEIKNAV